MCTGNIIMINAVPNTILWDVTLCSLINVSCHFRERMSAAWKKLRGYREGEIWGQNSGCKTRSKGDTVIA
jgi:hypothetical protein